MRDADIRAFIADAAQGDGPHLHHRQPRAGQGDRGHRPAAQSRPNISKCSCRRCAPTAWSRCRRRNGAFRVQPIDNAASQPSRVGSGGREPQQLRHRSRPPALDRRDRARSTRVRPLVSAQGSVTANRARQQPGRRRLRRQYPPHPRSAAPDRHATAPSTRVITLQQRRRARDRDRAAPGCSVQRAAAAPAAGRRVTSAAARRGRDRELQFDRAPRRSVDRRAPGRRSRSISTRRRGTARRSASSSWRMPMPSNCCRCSSSWSARRPIRRRQLTLTRGNFAAVEQQRHRPAGDQRTDPGPAGAAAAAAVPRPTASRRRSAPGRPHRRGRHALRRRERDHHRRARRRAAPARRRRSASSTRAASRCWSRRSSSRFPTPPPSGSASSSCSAACRAARSRRLDLQQHRAQPADASPARSARASSTTTTTTVNGTTVTTTHRHRRSATSWRSRRSARSSARAAASAARRGRSASTIFGAIINAVKSDTTSNLLQAPHADDARQPGGAHPRRAGNPDHDRPGAVDQFRQRLPHRRSARMSASSWR